LNFIFGVVYFGLIPCITNRISRIWESPTIPNWEFKLSFLVNLKNSTWNKYRKKRIFSRRFVTSKSIKGDIRNLARLLPFLSITTQQFWKKYSTLHHRCVLVSSYYWNCVSNACLDKSWDCEDQDEWLWFCNISKCRNHDRLSWSSPISLHI